MQIKHVIGCAIIGAATMYGCSNNKNDVVKQNAKEVIIECDTMTHVPFDCYIPNSRDIGVIKNDSGKAVSRIIEVVTKIKK